MNKTIRYLDDSDTVNRELKKLLLAEMTRDADGPYGLLLSGGSTPLKTFADIAANPAPVSEHLHIIQADERIVPEDSEDSNYRHLRPMLKALNIPGHRILRVKSDLGIHDAASRYDHDLGRFLARGGRIRLGLLGLGEDGHTCSIFSSDAARIRDALAFPVPARGGFDRVSVSAAVLAQTERIVFMVTGARKAAVLKQFLLDSQSTPAGLAVAGHEHLEIWSDLPRDRIGA